MIRHPRRPPLFPYTPLSGSDRTRHDPVDLRQRSGCEGSGAGKILLHLLGAARSCQDETDDRLCEDPCERERRQRHVEPPGARAEPLDRHPPALELPALEPVNLASRVGGWEIRALMLLTPANARAEWPRRLGC